MQKHDLENGWILSMFYHAWEGPPYNKNPISCVLKKKNKLIGWDTKNFQTGLIEARLRLTTADAVVE